MKKIILLFAIVLFYTNVQAQTDKKELVNFEFDIQTSENQIILKSKNGSAWEKLTFSKNNLPQAIDEYGMTEMENDVNKRKKSESTLADYTFTIKKEKDKIILTGLEGTAWTELSYNCVNENCASRINELGMM